MSVAEPATCELVINVRADDPDVAVIVTDVALVAFQFSVTLCPELIELVFAEKTKVGGGEPLLVLVLLLLEQEDKHSAVAINPRAIPRKQIVVISSCAAVKEVAIDVRQNRCQGGAGWLPCTRVIWGRMRRFFATAKSSPERADYVATSNLLSYSNRAAGMRWQKLRSEADCIVGSKNLCGRSCGLIFLPTPQWGGQCKALAQHQQLHIDF